MDGRIYASGYENHRKETPKMTRKFQVLGLAVFAVLAMGVVMASAAQAAPELTCNKNGAKSYPCTIEATGEGVGEKFVVEGGNKVECKVSHYHATLEAASSTLTVAPTYTECEAFGLSATVNTEECKYVFHATEKVTTDNYKAHVDISCPEGQSIKISAGFGACQVDVEGHGGATPVNQGLTTVDIENMTNTPTTPNDITITPTLTGGATEMDGKHGPVAYNITKDGFGCPLNGTGARTGGEYSTANPITAIATEDVNGQPNGVQVDLEVSGE